MKKLEKYVLFFLIICVKSPPEVEACDHVLMHGVNFVNGIALGRYIKEDYTYYGRPVYKQENGGWYFWMYYGVYWIIGMRVGNLSPYIGYAYASSSAREHPAQIPGSSYYINNNGWGYNYYLRIECEGTLPPIAILRFGRCPPDVDVLTELVDTTSTPAECSALCTSSPECEGWTYSRDGCFPRSKSCSNQELTDDVDYQAFEYAIGIMFPAGVGQPTHQSSDHPDYPEGTSDRAADGNLENRMLWNPHCSHTNKEIQPWWAVELAEPLVITSVAITNRQDCCSERLDDIQILLGNNGPFSENENRINSREFTEARCATVSSIEPGKREVIKCSEALANYIVITYLNPNVETILTLCEVEIDGFVAGQYQGYVPMKGTAGATADEFCAERFNGYPVHIRDDHEWGMVKDYIDTNLPGACMNRRVWGITIGNKYGTGDWDTRVMYEGSHLLGGNIALDRYDAECSSSSYTASSNDCWQAMDNDFNTYWESYSEGTGAWIEITLRYPYHISLIAILQNTDANFDLVSLDFANSVYFNDFYLPEDINEWGLYYLKPVVTSDWVIITALEVRNSGNTGFREIKIYAKEPVGYGVRDGDCTQNTIATVSGDEVECSAECTNMASCAGYVFHFSSLMCDLKSAICSPEDTIQDADKTIYYKTEVNAMALRHGDCHGYDHYGSSGETPQACYEKCVQNRDCRLHNYKYSSGSCWIKFRNCEESSYDNTKINTVISERGFNETYINCFYGTSPFQVPDTDTGLSVSSNAECVEHCSQRGYKYAATTNGIEFTCIICLDEDSTQSCTMAEYCKCGDSITAPLGVGLNSRCLLFCSGGEDNCGGNWASSVYSSEPEDRTCLSIVMEGPIPMIIAEACGWDKCLVCERDFDPCVSNPCLNNATCNGYENYYNCTCISGYDGTLCEEEVDECLSEPCQNGATCLDEIDGYICQCSLGYIGEHCEIDYNECNDGLCENNSTCSEGAVGEYLCDCLLGYTGINCESEIDECLSNPCQNEAPCSEYIGYHNCACLEGYTGYNCETDINECMSGPCVNDSTCIDGVDGFTCDCSPGFGGTLCGIDLDECGSDPCQNGGTCEDLLAEYICHCTGGFTGTNCETNINECSGDPCVNHIECQDLIGDYLCVCLAGFAGQNCETYVGNPGQWTAWGNWSDCSVTCGTGVEYRSRTCVADFPELGQGHCNGLEHENKVCNRPVCPPVNGEWGAWSPAEPCQVVCGPGIGLLSRSCDAPPPEYGGEPCPVEDPTEKQGICFSNPCPEYRYPGVWTEWTECSEQCTGTSSRYRYVYSSEEDIPEAEVVQNASAHNAIEDIQTKHCDCDTGLVCQVCDLSLPFSGSSIPTCPPGGDYCTTDQEFCGFVYSNDGSILSLSKMCMSKTQCDKALTSQKRKECRQLIGITGSYSSAERASSSGSRLIFTEDVLDKWRRLAEECRICCQGNMCNDDVLPESWTLVQPSASGSSLPDLWLTFIALSAIGEILREI